MKRKVGHSPKPRPTARSRVLSRDDAAKAVRRAQRRGERVVFTSGCFDLLHVGHIRSLEEARALGDRLIVALNTDASVRRMKGETRPIVTARQRAEVIAALACVDWVTTFGQATPRPTLALIRPDIYAKGGDWPLEVLLAKDVPQGLDLEVHRLREIPRIRTTGIVERAQGNREAPDRRRTDAGQTDRRRIDAGQTDRRPKKEKGGSKR